MKKNSLTYKIGILLILLLPILNYPPLFAPPAFGKAIVFRVIFSITLLLCAYFFFFNKDDSIFKKVVEKIKVKKSALFYAPLALLGVLVLSTIFSKDILFSIFGDPERGGGVLTFGMIILFSYFLILFLEKKQWEGSWKVSFACGAAVSMIALAQIFGLSEIIVKTSSRPFSTMGNTTVLASYLLLLVFPLVSFFIKEKKKSVKAVYLASLVLFLSVILLTYTRSAFIGLFIGFLYFFLFYPKKGVSMLVVRFTAVVLAALTIFSVYYVNNHQIPDFVENNTVLRGVTNRLSIEKAMDDARIGGFIIAWEAIKEKPLLGYGPENFAIGFNKHYHPEIPSIGRDIPWWDKAHNFFLEMGVWGGFPAIIALLSIFVFAFVFLQKRKREEKTESHAFQTALIAFFLVSMFSIDTFSVHLIFFILCAYIISLSLKETGLSKKEEKYLLQKRKTFVGYKTAFLIISAPLFLVFIYGFNIAPLLANKNMNMALAYQRGGNCEKSLEAANLATKEQTVIDSYLYRYKAELINHCVKDKDQHDSAAREALGKVLETRPLHIQTLINLSSLNLNTLPKLKEEEKIKVLEETQHILKTLVEASPNRYEIHINKARVDIIIKEYEEAYKSANTCLSLRSDAHCFFLRAVSSAAIGKSGVKEDMEEAKNRRFSIEENSVNMLINAYAYAENYEAIIPLYKTLIEDHPENLQYYSSIAATFKEAGNYDKAREYAMKIVEIDPNMRMPVEEFLKTLPN